jgi:phospholipid N-methyltransferase
LSIFHDSAENVKKCLTATGRTAADYVISGIPFSMLPPEVADRIVKNTLDILQPGGKFLIYQFLKPETKTSKGIHQYLPSHFNAINKEVEMLNIPPLWIYEATK